jgi:hypothetical protein
VAYHQRATHADSGVGVIVCMVIGCRRPRERGLSHCRRHDPVLGAAHARVVARNAEAHARRQIAAAEKRVNRLREIAVRRLGQFTEKAR